MPLIAGAVREPDTSTCDAWAMFVVTPPTGKVALVNGFLIRFCEPPPCASRPPITVPPSPSGFVRPSRMMSWGFGDACGVAGMVRVLASDDAYYAIGQVISVDGSIAL